MSAGAIEGYLERLDLELAHVGLRRRRKARILAEVRDHLQESTRKLRSQGLTPEAAQQEAVTRFGRPAAFARSYRHTLAAGAACANGVDLSLESVTITSPRAGHSKRAAGCGGGENHMNVVEYSERLLPDLRRLANQHLALVPPGWELTERQLATVLRDPDQVGTYFREEPIHGTTETFCVMDRDEMVAAGCLWRPDRQDPRWSSGQYARQHRDSGQGLWILADPASGQGLRVLLDAFAERAGRLGCDGLTAGACGLGTARHGMPMSWSHLVTGLEEFGFETDGQGVLMHAPLRDVDPGEPPAVDGLTFEWHHDPAAPEWELHALIDGTRIGECSVWGMSRHVGDRADYRQWVNFEWVEVTKPYRRQGIGRWLIREQMRAQRERGAKHALLQVYLPDPLAVRFHEALGFTRLQEWRTYRKERL